MVGVVVKAKIGEFFGDCGKVGRENGAMECPYGGTHNGTHDDIILKKVESHGRL